jgi:enoyl-CoA hydratase/carnithine racemase
VREIRYEVADRVATLTIDRPEKRGAMTYAMRPPGARPRHAHGPGRVLRSADHDEGVAAFLERRPARFTGR